MGGQGAFLCTFVWAMRRTSFLPSALAQKETSQHSSQHVQQTPNSSATSNNNERRLVNKGQDNDWLGAISPNIGTSPRLHHHKARNSWHVKVKNCRDVTPACKTMTNLSCTPSISEETAQVECQNITHFVKYTLEGAISNFV